MIKQKAAVTAAFRGPYFVLYLEAFAKNLGSKYSAQESKEAS